MTGQTVAGYGVSRIATTGHAVNGVATTGIGAIGYATSGYGTYGYATTTGVGARGYSISGTGGYFSTSGAKVGTALRALGKVKFDNCAGVATIASGTNSIVVTPRHRPARHQRRGRHAHGQRRGHDGREARYYRCPAAGRAVIPIDGGYCNARLVRADVAEAAVLSRISAGRLPEADIDAARVELARRLNAPRARDTQTARERLNERLERLRRQHEWGHLADSAYRAKRAEVEAEMALLTDGNKLILFDRRREVLTTMADNLAAATTEQQAEIARLLIQRIVVRGQDIQIVWNGPARPFFAPVGDWCPQGDSNP